MCYKSFYVCPVPYFPWWYIIIGSQGWSLDQDGADVDHLVVLIISLWHPRECLSKALCIRNTASPRVDIKGIVLYRCNAISVSAGIQIVKSCCKIFGYVNRIWLYPLLKANTIKISLYINVHVDDVEISLTTWNFSVPRFLTDCGHHYEAMTQYTVTVKCSSIIAPRDDR